MTWNILIEDCIRDDRYRSYVQVVHVKKNFIVLLLACETYI
jgi:hypothetical protein